MVTFITAKLFKRLQNPAIPIKYVHQIAHGSIVLCTNPCPTLFKLTVLL